MKSSALRKPTSVRFPSPGRPWPSEEDVLEAAEMQARAHISDLALRAAHLDGPIVKIEEVAGTLGCGIEHVMKMLETGLLPAIHRRDGDWVIPREGFYRRLNEMAEEEATNRRVAAARKPRIA